MVDFFGGMRESSKVGTKLAGKTQGLFSSMLNTSNGLLTGLSNKLEAALSISIGDSDSDNLSSKNGNESQEDHKKNSSHKISDWRYRKGSDSSSYEPPYYFAGSHHPKRQLAKLHSKDRSVFGQPPKISLVSNRAGSDLSRAKAALDALDAQMSASGPQDPFDRLRLPHQASDPGSSDDNEPSTSIDSDVGRSGSEASLQSWASSLSYDSQPDEITVECMEFMKKFVDELFKDSAAISLETKAKFGEFCQLEPGRLWFARYVNTQRVNNKRVDESTFYSLVQYFAIVLFECNESDDFSPAKSLMNMCFTFYHEVAVPGCEPYKEFLYLYLKDQPIWQSLRFWNAAFFDAVQCERAHRPIVTREDFAHYSLEEVTDERQFQENITFGQLGTFTCNMHAFGLNKELCLEFLRKQSTIANLKPEHIRMLQDNIERMYRETQGWR